jgi:hypothetical protein
MISEQGVYDPTECRAIERTDHNSSFWAPNHGWIVVDREP